MSNLRCTYGGESSYELGVVTQEQDIEHDGAGIIASLPRAANAILVSHRGRTSDENLMTDNITYLLVEQHMPPVTATQATLQSLPSFCLLYVAAGASSKLNRSIGMIEDTRRLTDA